jgi:hypothetical protein
MKERKLGMTQSAAAYLSWQIPNLYPKVKVEKEIHSLNELKKKHN